MFCNLIFNRFIWGLMEIKFGYKGFIKKKNLRSLGLKVSLQWKCRTLLY